MIGPEPLRIRFDKVDWFVRVYDGTRYFTLFGTEKYDVIYNKIRCLIGVKSGITRDISHNYTIIKVDSYDSLSIEKKTLHNVIKSFLNKDQNHCYYNIFLKKYSDELAKKQWCIRIIMYNMIMLTFGETKVAKKKFHGTKKKIKKLWC